MPPPSSRVPRSTEGHWGGRLAEESYWGSCFDGNPSAREVLLDLVTAEKDQEREPAPDRPDSPARRTVYADRLQFPDGSRRAAANQRPGREYALLLRRADATVSVDHPGISAEEVGEGDGECLLCASDYRTDLEIGSDSVAQRNLVGQTSLEPPSPQFYVASITTTGPIDL